MLQTTGVRCPWGCSLLLAPPRNLWEHVLACVCLMQCRQRSLHGRTRLSACGLEGQEGSLKAKGAWNFCTRWGSLMGGSEAFVQAFPSWSGPVHCSVTHSVHAPCPQGIWGTACQTFMDSRLAATACRSQGRLHGLPKVSLHRMPLLAHIWLCTGVPVVPSYHPSPACLLPPYHLCLPACRSVTSMDLAWVPFGSEMFRSAGAGISYSASDYYGNWADGLHGTACCSVRDARAALTPATWAPGAGHLTALRAAPTLAILASSATLSEVRMGMIFW